MTYQQIVMDNIDNSLFDNVPCKEQTEFKMNEYLNLLHSISKNIPTNDEPMKEEIIRRELEGDTTIQLFSIFEHSNEVYNHISGKLTKMCKEEHKRHLEYMFNGFNSHEKIAMILTNMCRDSHSITIEKEPVYIPSIIDCTMSAFTVILHKNTISNKYIPNKRDNLVDKMVVFKKKKFFFIEYEAIEFI